MLINIVRSNMEFSVVMSGDLLCNMLCSYCSATGIDKSDYKNKKSCSFGQPVWDWNGMKKVFDTNPIIQKAIKEKTIMTLNFWGSEPLLWYKEYEKYFDWVDKNYPDLKYHTFISTNGLLLGAKPVQDFILREAKNRKLKLQLSHDGVGQYCRSQKFDPLYDPKTKDFIIKLVKMGCLDMINASLNQYNNSPFANKLYFDKWRFDNHLEEYPMLIKLNHNNDSEYTKDYKLTGEPLRLYMHELELMMQQAALAREHCPKVPVYGGRGHLELSQYKNNTLLDQLWQPYTGSFSNQMRRYDYYKGPGGCASFSLGISETTWCCNSKGEYVFCQLCNDPDSNPNPNVERPEHCKDCEYRYYNECFPCPDMVFAKNCEYKKEYIRLMQRMKQFLYILDNMEIRNENNK